MKNLTFLLPIKAPAVLILFLLGAPGNSPSHPRGLSVVIAFDQVSSLHTVLQLMHTELPPDLAAARIYLDHSSPFTPLNRITGFLFGIRKKNNSSRIRNGNLPASLDHLHTLEASLDGFRRYTASLDVPPSISKKDFRIRHETGAGPLKSRIWNDFKKQKRSVEKNYKKFRFQLGLTFSTELAILQQQEHLPELYREIGLFQNLDGTELPVYVITLPRLNVDPANQVIGVAMFVQYKGLFSSLCPALERKYPQLPGKDNALTVYLAEKADGKVLSHEFGHLYYLYHHWNDYTAYILARGSGYEFGSHEEGDPSGKAALMAESGVMPD